MRRVTTFRAVVLGALIAILGVPPSALHARTAAAAAIARQQEGPAKPSGGQSSEPAKQPTGQQQPATAGQPQSQAPQTAISVSSNLVNIDAVVTDFDGNIIQGLQKANFRVLDDGQPQQITNFAAERGADHGRDPDGVQQTGGRLFRVQRQELGVRIFAALESEGLGGVQDVRFAHEHSGGLHAEQAGSGAGGGGTLFPGLQRSELFRCAAGDDAAAARREGQESDFGDCDGIRHVQQAHAGSDAEERERNGCDDFLRGDGGRDRVLRHGAATSDICRRKIR